MTEGSFEVSLLPGQVIVPHTHFLDPLLKELKGPIPCGEKLLYVSKDPGDLVWAQDQWQNVQKIEFSSINQAAKALRECGDNWFLFPNGFHRRAALIESKIDSYSNQRLCFPRKPKSDFGCWSLISKNELWASRQTVKNVPSGAYEFDEDRQTPPNRAYLKLWEAFTTLGRFPQKGETCFDMGACPGGWSWVLQSLGGQVTAVDKAALDPKIQKLPGIKFLQESAFSLSPKDYGPIDWFCSDIICYPEKLYDWVNRWIQEGQVKNFLCTVKLQGETDMAVLNRFKQFKGSRLWHLYHNKHEVTWFYQVP